MSSNLRAEPVDRKKLELGTGLKFALRKIYGEPVNIQLGKHNLDFLNGLIAAGTDDIVTDTKKLIEYIAKHGDCIIKEEY
jgi:hypothetical protein